MNQSNPSQIEEELIYYRKKVALLEEIIRRSNNQKARLAQVISKLIKKIE